MQKCLAALVLLFLSACSSTPLTYDPQKNCSQQALNHVTPPASEADKKFYQEKFADIQHFFANTLTPQLHKCYQDYLDSAATPREFAVCTQTTIQDGKVTFVDADDKVNLINDQLKVCLESKIKAADWTFIKRKSAISIRQPVMMRARHQ